MNIFVTGGTGFIGSHFLQYALAKGHNIVAIKRRKSHTKELFNKKIKWLEKDFDNVSKDDFSDIDALVHLASSGVTPQPASWEECFDFNVNKSVALTMKAIQAGVKRFVITGSYAEYGKSGLHFDFIPTDAPLEPTDIYAASKASSSIAFKALALIENVEMIYLRLFSVFGEGQNENNFWPSLKKAAMSGDDFKMTKGEQIRDFINVLDVVKQIEIYCRKNDVKSGEMLIENVASGKPVTLKEFAEYWWIKWEARGTINYGAIPYRKNEQMRYVPKVTSSHD